MEMEMVSELRFYMATKCSTADTQCANSYSNYCLYGTCEQGRIVQYPTTKRSTAQRLNPDERLRHI